MVMFSMLLSEFIYFCARKVVVGLVWGLSSCLTTRKCWMHCFASTEIVFHGISGYMNSAFLWAGGAPTNLYKVHIYIYITVSQCMSRRRNWDPPPPRRCPPHPQTKGGGHTHLGVMEWGPNSNDWRKGLALALCLLPSIFSVSNEHAVFCMIFPA